MKKLLLIVLMLFVALTAFPQEPETRQLAEYDGNDWMQWIPPQKYTWVQGFMTAQQAMIFALQSFDLPPEIVALFSSYLFIPESVVVVANRIEYYYRTTGDLNASIWSVLYYIYDKEWWGLEPEIEPVPEVEPSISPPAPQEEPPIEKIEPIKPKNNGSKAVAYMY